MSTDLYRRLSVKPFSDRRGALCVWEQDRHVPYRIARTYFMYEVPNPVHRGDHAHRRLERTLIALAGAADLALEDGRQQHRLRLDNPAEGIYVPPMVWTDLHNFTADAVILCLASLPYEEADYIRDKQIFLKEKSAQ
jgi:dTDP-4-dehydrorhamnose 3,5-epimerase-like enzyme